MSRETYLLCAAIDFGTTFSGYAFSAKHEFDQDPLRVSASSWTTGSRMTISLKTSTAVLFRPDQSFDSFGFEAEDRYNDLAMDGDHAKWYYFRRFKMSLFDSKSVHRSNMLADGTGKQLPAIFVFSACIKFMKDHLVRSLSDRMLGLEEKDIKWVLTVPAIWDDAAKQFMREAAEKAGIRGDRLMLALEPEAASMFCKYLPVERIVGAGKGNGITCFSPGSKYLVLDAGGGTVDITVHEVSRDGTLRELFKANGGAWGGTTIDEAFINFITSIAGPSVMEQFRIDNQDDYIDLLREFEVKKRSVEPSMESKVTFKIPISLHELYREHTGKEIRDAVRNNETTAGKVAFAGDKMRVEAETVKGLFQPTCSKIVEHLRALFEDPIARETSTILMVGGFSESPMLRNAVQGAFPGKRVIIPHEAGLAVLKGAVIFGHNSNIIRSRIAKYTYGLKCYKSYDPSRHPKARVLKNEKGELTVRGCFDKIVEVGESVSPDMPTTPKCYQPSGREDAFGIKLFASPNRDPIFVDEDDCKAVGEVSVNCRCKDGTVSGASVSLIFGGTELGVTAVHKKTGKETNASFDFLE